MKRREKVSAHVNLRVAARSDLPTINRVIVIWELAGRVKRLAMPTCPYSQHYWQNVYIVLAEDSAADIAGVTAWQAAAVRDLPNSFWLDLKAHGA